MPRRLLFLLLLLTCLVLLPRVAERYSWQADLSAQRSHSLSQAATRALEALPGMLEITAYVPDLPVTRAQTRQLLAPYTAHSRGVLVRYVDPLAEPERARADGVTRAGELHLRSGERHEVVADPDRSAIDSALERLALRGERWIVTLRGHGERAIDTAPGGLGTLVEGLERLGYRVIAVDPAHLDALPDNTALLLVAGPVEPYPARVEALIMRHLESGGSLLWLMEGPLPDALARALGVEGLPGVVVDAAAAQYGLEQPEHAVVSDFPPALLPATARAALLRRAIALHWTETGDWQLRARLQSSPRSWNETGSLRGQITRDTEDGEEAGPLTVGVALEHPGPAGPARAVLLGGAEFVGNGQVAQGDNLALAIGLVRWLTGNRGLAPPASPAGLEIRWSPNLAAVLALASMGIAPLLYLGAGLWLRHRRRRA